MALSSDLDGTPSFEHYIELIRRLNAPVKEAPDQFFTARFANSLYFRQPDGKFCYDHASEADRSLLRNLIHSGHIDTLHSFGDDVREPKDVDACLAELGRHQLKFPVWTNHSLAPTNIWSPRKRHVQGADDPKSPLYHADQWPRMGICYFERGQTSAVLGQDSLPNPFRSLTRLGYRDMRGCAIAAAKILSAPVMARWRRQLGNRLAVEAALRDSTRRVEIMRSNWMPEGIKAGSRPAAATVLLRPAFLERLARSGGAVVLYTHLGTVFKLPSRDRARVLDALDRFRTECWRQRILVDSTSRLLDFGQLRRHLRVHSEQRAGQTRLHVSFNTPTYLSDRLAYQLWSSGLTMDVTAREKPEAVVRQRPASRRDSKIEIAERAPGRWRVSFPHRANGLPTGAT